MEFLIDDLADGTRGLDDVDLFLAKMWSAIEQAEAPMGCMVLNTRSEFGRSAPDVLAICDNFTDRQVAAISAAFRRSAETGEIDPELTDQHILSFRMMLNGAQHLVRTNGSGSDVRAAFQAVRRTVQGWRLA